MADTTRTRELVQAYYASWQAGEGGYDEGRLRSVLAPNLHFEGPIAGVRDGLEPFLAGLGGVVRVLKARQMVHQVYSGNEAATLYDCELGAAEGTLRFAEFFRVQDGRIQEIRLLYDPTEFRRRMAP